jgi:hypothetical protein
MPKESDMKTVGNIRTVGTPAGGGAPSDSRGSMGTGNGTPINGHRVILTVPDPGKK